MTEWYYADRQGQQRGPVQSQELLALRSAGQIGMDTLVWRNGMSDWQPFSTVANELQPPQPESVSPMQGASMYEVAQPAPAAVAADTATPAPSPASGGSYSMYETAAPIVRNDAQSSDPYAAPRAQVGGNAVALQGGHVVYAGFWKRVAAVIVDMFAIGIPLAIVLGLLGAIFGISTGGFERGLNSGNPGLTVLGWILQAVVFAWFYSNAR